MPYLGIEPRHEEIPLKPHGNQPRAGIFLTRTSWSSTCNEVEKPEKKACHSSKYESRNNNRVQDFINASEQGCRNSRESSA